MASVSQRRTPRRQESIESRRTAAAGPARRRWFKRLVLGITLCTTVVLVLPTVVAYTPLRNAPLRFVLNGMHASVQCGGASLSWFGPIRYTDIEVRDAHGELLLAIPKAESERSLVGLLSNLTDLGTIRIERPHISLAMRPGGSNIEDVFAAGKKPREAKPPIKLPTLTAQIVDGAIDLTDAQTSQHWQVEKLNLSWTTSPDSMLPADVSLAAQVPYEGKTAQLTITSAANQQGNLERIDAQIDGLPLAMFRALADRVAPGLQLTGTLSSKLRCACPEGDPARGVQITGGVAIDQMLAAGGPLGADRLTLARIDVPCQLAIHDRNVTINQLALACDVGQLALAGNCALPNKIGTQQVDETARSVISLEGRLDLAKLAALLPATLRIRSGTQITGGQVQLALSEKPDVAATVWSGQLTASDLTALENGRQLSLGQPVAVQFAIRQQGENASVDQLQCSSSFFTLNGHGSVDQFQASAQCDLDRLMSELSQFIDLGALRLAGRGDAQISWQRAAGGQFQVNADARVQSLQIAVPNKPVWQEETIIAGIAASGSVENLELGHVATAKLTRLDAARLSATVENAGANSREQIDVQILQPVIGVVGTQSKIQINSATLPKPKYPFSAHVQAQMGRWWPRLAAWLGIDATELAGATDLTAMGTYCDSQIQFQQLRGAVNGFHGWWNNALFVDEPAVQLDAAGGFDFTSGRLSLEHATLLTSTVSLQTESVLVGLSRNGPFTLQGNLAYQADLNRLERWFNDPRVPPKYVLAGRLTGNAGVARSGVASAGKFEAAVDNFAVYTSGAPAGKSSGLFKSNPSGANELLWTEKHLTISANGGFDSLADSFQVSAAQIDSESLQLRAAGNVDRLKTQPNLNMAGKVDYDWARLGPLLKPILGNNLEIAGRESREFSLRGPLSHGGNELTLASRASSNMVSANVRQIDAPDDTWSILRPMVGDFSLGWSQASAFGMLIGKIDAHAHLENGLVKFQPIQTTIGDRRSGKFGKLNIIPSLKLNSDASELVLEKSALLSDVQISQKLSNSWLKFIAPVMAEATRTEGTFSLDLESARIPLEEPAKADVSGRLNIETMEVVPGPLVRPLVLIGEQIEALAKRRPPPLELPSEPVLVKIDNQKVDFHMVDGRIYHQSLAMQIGETTIRTRGWVGVDESIGLVAEVPLRRELQNNPIFASQRDGVIQIPISGTLRQWKIDNRAIGQLLQSATRGVIENELGKQLDRLFNPPQR